MIVMKTFVIDNEALKKAWGADNQYWFDLSDYSIFEDYNALNLVVPDNFDKEDILNYEGIIPYYNIKRVELARAYVQSTNSDKLKTIFASLDDSEVVEYFWKYCHAYPEYFQRIEEFQHEYILGNLKDWCEKNNIKYTVEL